MDSKPREWKKPTLDGSLTDARPKQCSHCHNFGHLKEECFKLKDCFFCGRRGHIKERCFNYRNQSSTTKFNRGPGRFSHPRGAHNAGTMASVERADAFTPLEDESAPLFAAHHSSQATLDPDLMNGLVDSVMQKVLQDFSDKQSPLSSSNFAGIIDCSSAHSAYSPSYSVLWIVDTGASDHMTSHSELLHDLQQLSKPILVCLPDGSVKSVHQTGKLQLTSSILLRHVLVVPDFKQNLLSVGRLLDQSNMLVTFSSHACLFQDLSNKVVLGTPVRKNDLYCFFYS
ncbi:hypothetical protein RND81_06G138700 [Saponaria officinalis]|uniref:CCHC-type domain-containing protein n=1 Tax=Saponaria officinalis TaxID=3572 RepID=A0AAW1KD50_SAPOF